MSVRATVGAGAFLALAILQPVAAALAQLDSKGVQIAFSAPRNLVLGEPVIVTLTVRTELPEPIESDLGLDTKEYLRIHMMGPDGVTIDVPPFVPDGFLVGGLRSPGRSRHRRCCSRCAGRPVGPLTATRDDNSRRMR